MKVSKIGRDALLLCFVGAITEYGIPKRVTTDKDLENVHIADFMIEKRGSNFKSESSVSKPIVCLKTCILQLHSPNSSNVSSSGNGMILCDT